jgi:hypothetical protein
LIADLREVFEATGPYAPQVVRDVIEYADSALQVIIGRMNDKALAAHEAEKAAPAPVAVPLREAEWTAIWGAVDGARYGYVPMFQKVERILAKRWGVKLEGGE